MGRRILVIGGGASGFFAAINIAEKFPLDEITILEKSSKTLQKVKISGGGRCNVTNAREKPSDLMKFYPRGGKKLYGLFSQFGTKDMVSWLAERGVATKTESDLRMFPASNHSQTIIDCFWRLIQQHHVQVRTGEGVDAIQSLPTGAWQVSTQSGKQYQADKLIIATGSSPAFWQKIAQLGLQLNTPVPSLFTFNIKDSRIATLPGVSFADAQVKIAGTKLMESGPLLITHWGLSGPAILKLSAWGARELEAKNYRFTIVVNFVAGKTFDEIRAELQANKVNHPQRKVENYPVEGIPKRYWENMLALMDTKPGHVFGELSKKQINKIAEEITQAHFEVTGKSTFKEEFVTCGGIDLAEVDLKTMQAVRFPNLYFCGEVLDIDAITGGFNFQSCWTTAWIVSEAI